MRGLDFTALESNFERDILTKNIFLRSNILLAMESGKRTLCRNVHLEWIKLTHEWVMTADKNEKDSGQSDYDKDRKLWNKAVTED